MSDLIKREDAIKAMEQRYEDILRTFKRKVKVGEKAIVLDMIGCVKNLPSVDRPSKTKAEMIAVMEEYRDKQLLMSDYWYGINWAINTIRTADISDEPSGEWIIRQPKPFFLCTCSACGETEEFMTKYCPNCGAGMKGADDDTD